MTDLIREARDWLRHDPDAATRAELAELIATAESGDAAAVARLRQRFAGPPEFGTAGLRAEIGAGESRMNVAVVVRATAGVVGYLADTVGTDATVVVGCDARHGSSDFMDATLAVISGAGLTALALPKGLPTPVTAYAVRALGAEAGIMVTASHNPSADNGYKVYLGGRATDDDGAGVQIIPPADALIAARIDAAPPADEVPRSTDNVVAVGESVVGDYVARMASHRAVGAPSAVRMVLSAMHGVGGKIALAVLAGAGVPDVHPVAGQFDPDPDFPTVTFPNPEEPGALDLSLALAREMAADVVVALDPDADRCAVAIPQRDGDWRQLTGDELGALLGEQAAADGSRPGDTLACSIVSSRMLGRIAEAHGLPWVQTLTGFKWIARTPGIRYGYEEAIGYCTDPYAVHDKDGIGAMMRVIDLVETLAAQELTIEDELDRLARRDGLHTTAQLSVRCDDGGRIADVMTRLRSQTPSTLAGSPIVEFVDLSADDGPLPPTDALLYRTDADDRVIIRPSGTEPKLKCYLEVISRVDGAAPIPRAAGAERIATITADLTRWLAV